MKKKRKHVIQPLIVGIIVSIITIIVIALYTPKYYTNIAEESVLNNHGEIYYSDLNNDGKSEKINYYHYDKIFQPTIYLYNEKDEFDGLWNFLESPVKKSRVFSGDYNNDNVNEIFVFTEKNDSLFLYILNPKDDSKYIIKRKFISGVTNNNLRILSLGLFNYKETKEKEFYFIVDANYPEKPIKLFSYNISASILKSSADINAKIKYPVIVKDINKDGEPEIIISNQSLGVTDKGTRAQLIIFDKNLQYLFNPVGFQGTQSSITAEVINSNNKYLIAALNSGTSDENVFNNLMLYDVVGNRVQEKNLDERSNLRIIDNYSFPESLILFSGKKIIKYNSDLRKIKSFKVSRNEKAQFICTKDITGDGKPEYLFKSKDKLIIVSEDLQSKSELNISTGESSYVSVLKKIGFPNQLSIQFENKWYLIDYYKNDASFYSQILYIFVFIVINLLTFLVFSFFRRKSILVGKLKENIFKELEGNIDKKISGLKSRLDEIKGEFKENSFIEALDEIEDAFDDVKSITKEVKNKENIKADLSISMPELLDKLDKSKFKPSFSLFPNIGWDDIHSEIENSVIEFCECIFKKLEENAYKFNLNIQLIHHKAYLNVLIEIENFYEENGILLNNKDLASILKRVKGTYNVDIFSDFGTVINLDIPLDFMQEKAGSRSKGKIKVIIAEDHDVSLFGLVSLIKTKEDIEIVGTARNGMEVLKILESKETDIVITDISMPGMDGIELSEKLQSSFPNVKVIVFTMYLENWFVEQLLNFGVRGFVSKNSKIIELTGAIRNVYNGDNYYCPQFKSKFGFKNTGNGNGNGNQLDSLTKIELQIMKSYADGLLKEQIAKEMNIGNKILDAFIANIMLKLNAGDEEEVIRIAKKQKFISD